MRGVFCWIVEAMSIRQVIRDLEHARILGILLLFISSFSTISAGEDDCENANTTLEINHCASVELVGANVEMQRYLSASLSHNDYDAQLVEAIRQSQIAWESYRDAHCGAVFTQWRDGSIRVMMDISCRTQLTYLRTHELWANFLTYMDNSPPVLPEPAK